MLIGRYIFRQTASALIVILVSLTLIVWLTTILREIKLITAQGQSVLVFLEITSLTIPNLIATVAPVAFLIATLHTLNRLAGDSELIVLSASGSSVWRLLRPYLALAFLVSATVLATNLFVLPWAARLLGDELANVRTDFLAQILQPGEFTELEKGLTFHIRDKAENGDLLGVVMHDERDKKMVTTVVAERGQILDDAGRPVMTLRDGQIIRQEEGKPEARIVVFDSYLFDLAELAPKSEKRDVKPRERSIGELLYPDAATWAIKLNREKYRSEIHERFSGALYPLIFMFIALVHLGRPRTTREGRAGALSGAFAVATAIRILGIAGVNIVGRNDWGLSLIYGVPLGGVAISLSMLAFNIEPARLSLPDIRPRWLFRRSKAALLPAIAKNSPRSSQPGARS